MKKLFLIIPILFFLSIKELKVISYNIRYNNPNDGINIWDNRKSTITKFLIDESPDFAGLQEVTYSQLSFLKDSLVNYSFIGVGRDDGKTKGEYSPIFYNKKNIKFYLIKLFGCLQAQKKHRLVGMLQWKEFVHTDYLKICPQKKNFGFLILILIMLVMKQEKNQQI